MKLLIIAQEMPYPPNHGGRADSWRRLKALSQLGHSSFLVTWAYVGQGRSIDPQHVARLEEFSARTHVLPVDRSNAGLLRRLRHAWRWPSFIAARVLSSAEYAKVLASARHFAPDAMLMDGLQGYWLAQRLSTDLDLSLLYRAHNREADYLAQQRRSARTWRSRLGLIAATRGLSSVEEQAHRISELVLEISVDDLQYWERLGYRNGRWLPPLPDTEERSRATSPPDVDIAYIGSLWAPSNIQGLRWFLHQVWPLIRQAHPDATFLIGGSDPLREVIRLCEASPGVELLANVEDAHDVLSRGRVLINPVWMSSGVNIKSIDMLAAAAPVVTTSHGVVGMRAEMRAFFHIADDPQAFAAACNDAIAHSRAGAAGPRRPAPSLPGIDILDDLLRDFEQQLKAARPRDHRGGSAPRGRSRD